MTYETCSICDKGIITEADMFVFQHRPSGDIFFHLDCYASKFINIPVLGASKRGQDWINFSREVLSHIENYTVPQYKDKGEDQASEWSIEMLIEQTKKYANRYGKNQRKGQEKLDFMKGAHYLEMAATRFQEEQNATC